MRPAGGSDGAEAMTINYGTRLGHCQFISLITGETGDRLRLAEIRN